MRITNQQIADIGVFFQQGLLVTGMCSLLVIPTRIERHALHYPPLLISVVGIIGGIIFLYYCHLIYARNKDTRLITTGLFRYTRHPMYTGMVMMNRPLWVWLNPLPTSFMILQTIFFLCTIAAAYCQEKETLLRYGKETEGYYARTPRIFFFYPLCQLRAKRSQLI